MKRARVLAACRAAATRALLMLAACRAPIASGPPPIAAPTPADGPAPVAAATLLAGEARAHGWELWAALNAPASRGRVWETWPSSDAVLGIAERRLRALKPFRDGNEVITERLPVMFAVAFDPIAAAFVRAHGLGRRAELARLRDEHRPMPELPRGSIAIKAVWYAIAAHGLTAMPIWDAEPVPDTHGNADRTWPRAIAVDPSRDVVPAGETAVVALDGKRLTARVVPLAAFIHHAMSPAEAEAAHVATGASPGSLALVAMHVTTKELPDWVWATYWWHDRAEAGPFAAGRPDAVTGEARGYLMDIAYTADAPCFNPWLEARFPDGQHSSCVTCHQRAVFGVDDYLPVTRGRLAPDDPYFTHRVATDFLWTLALEAR